MSCIDELDASVCAAHQERVKMAAVESENSADAQLMETLSQQIASEQLTTFGSFELDAVARHSGLWICLSAVNGLKGLREGGVSQAAGEK